MHEFQTHVVLVTSPCDVEAFANFDSVKLTVRKIGHPMDGNEEDSRNDQFRDEHIVSQALQSYLLLATLKF